MDQDARYLAQTPRSARKKGASGHSPEGTSFDPLSISAWSDLQLANYCLACGIDFNDQHNHKSNCLEHSRKLESLHACHSEAHLSAGPR